MPRPRDQAMTEIQQLLHTLGQPEYVHVLLNPLPVYGLTMALIALGVGLVTRSKAAQITGLLLVVSASVAVWPVVEYGEHGYDRVLSMSNNDAQLWLKVHAYRASRFAVVFYVTAAVAAAALVATWKSLRADRMLTLLVLLAAMVSLAVGGWISHAGGQVRHSEFREGPPPHPVEYAPDGD